MDRSTAERILDAAESLFADHGFDGASLRAITAAAEVNLAAVHYHFGSKERLAEAVIRRRIEPVNRQRIDRLDAAIETARPALPSLEAVLDAFVSPTIDAFHDIGSEQLMGLIQLLHDAPLAPGFFEQLFGEILERFAILHRILPHLSGEEVAWRMHFLIGGMMHGLAGKPVRIDPRLQKRPAAELAQVLVTWAAAGFRAPATLEALPPNPEPAS